jgi:hypothetical protein
MHTYGPEFKPEWCKARLDDFKKFYGSAYYYSEQKGADKEGLS